ncbi:Spo0E family sporulation regulatory protein-aspartic acid phosphatase [Syntrophomonas curvata]
MVSSPAKAEQISPWEDDINKINQILAEIIKEQKSLWPDYTAIINLVESLRERLENLVTLKESFTDPEVLAASQALDEALNELYRIYFVNYKK